jgi:hypothetical protein
MRGLKIDRCGTLVIKCSFPPGDANAPLIARLESGEAPFRMRRDEIVSVENREIQEFARDLNAHRVQPEIFRASAAEAVAIKAGHRVATTTFQFRSQNIRGHEIAYRVIVRRKPQRVKDAVD